MAAALAAGQVHRLLWIDGAAIRIQSGRDADARGEEGQQIYFKRREDVDHQRLDRRCGGGGGQSGRRQSPRDFGWKKDAGGQDLGHPPKKVAARLRDVRRISTRTGKLPRKTFDLLESG